MEVKNQMENEERIEERIKEMEKCIKLLNEYRSAIRAVLLEHFDTYDVDDVDSQLKEDVERIKELEKQLSVTKEKADKWDASVKAMKETEELLNTKDPNLLRKLQEKMDEFAGMKKTGEKLVKIREIMDKIIKIVRFDLDWCIDCNFYFPHEMDGCDKCAPIYGEEGIEDSYYICKLKPCWNDHEKQPKLLLEQCADYHPDFKPCDIYKLVDLLGLLNQRK